MFAVPLELKYKEKQFLTVEQDTYKQINKQQKWVC